MMDISGDFFIGKRIQESDLRSALARATHLPPDDVRSIDAPHEPGDERRMFVITVNADRAGDYPGQFIVNADSQIVHQFDAIMALVARDLRTPILSASGLEGPDLMILSLPDGSMHQVAIEQDADEGIRNTPEMRHLIERGRRSPARAA